MNSKLKHEFSATTGRMARGPLTNTYILARKTRRAPSKTESPP